MKVRPIIIVIIITSYLLASCGISEEEYLLLQTKNEEFQAEITSLQNDLNNSNNEIETLKVNISDLEQEKEDYEIVIEEYEEKSSELKELTQEVKKEKSSLQTELRKLEYQLSFFMCDESISSMKYETILNVSNILSGWLAKQSYVVRTNYTYRDTIWNNTDTKIHSVQYLHTDGETYVDHFLVYFDEFGWTEGVFWLSGQCWLTKE